MTNNLEVDAVIRNVQVVTPSGILRDAGVAINQGRIAAIGEEGRKP